MVSLLQDHNSEKRRHVTNLNDQIYYARKTFFKMCCIALHQWFPNVLVASPEAFKGLFHPKIKFL